MVPPLKYLSLLCALSLGASVSAQTFESELASSDGKTSDQHGTSIAISGDTVVSGGLYDRINDERSGSAVVYVRTAGTWAQEGIFGPSDGRKNDFFGSSVGIDGDTIIVGSPGHRTGAGGGAVPAEDQGAAYVFVRSAGTWSQQAKLIANDDSAFDLFGTSVAISGNTAIIGASNGDAGIEDTGAAYVFTRSGTSWSQQAKLTANDAAFKDNFGDSVHIDGDTAIVGAPSSDSIVNNGGAAYVFTRSGSSWSQQDKLTDDSIDGRFGKSVAVDGDQALIGGTRTTTTVFESGGAFVYTRSGTSWTRDAELVASDAVSGDTFGSSVSLSGGIAVVGATGVDTLGDRAGAAYVFAGAGSSWNAGTKVTAPGGMTFDLFGTAVAADGDLFAIGASAGDGNRVDSGLGYAYAVADSFSEYCFCTMGPCSNDDASAGCANSTGMGGRMIASGTASAAADDLVLTLSNLPASQFGIAYMGGGQVNQPFGDGNRCVGPGPFSICRFPVQSTGAGGTFTEGPGIVSFSQGLDITCRIDAGETWHFQGWFRDPAGPCGSGFNLTNAVSVTFAP